VPGRCVRWPHTGGASAARCSRQLHRVALGAAPVQQAWLEWCRNRWEYASTPHCHGFPGRVCERPRARSGRSASCRSSDSSPVARTGTTFSVTPGADAAPPWGREALPLRRATGRTAEGSGTGCWHRSRCGGSAVRPSRAGHPGRRPAPSRCGQSRGEVSGGGLRHRLDVHADRLGRLALGCQNRSPALVLSAGSVPPSSAGRSRPCRQSAAGAVTANRQRRPRKTPSCCFGGGPGTGIDRRKLPTRAGRWQAPGCMTAHARCWPRRSLPTGTLLPPQVDHPPHSDHQNEHVKLKAVNDQHPLAPARGREQQVPPHAGIPRGGHHDPPAGPQNWPPAPRQGGLGRHCSGQPGGQVSGECGQLRVGPRCERLAHPQVEFMLGQPPLHERGLEGADHLLPVGVRGPQVTAASCRYLVSRPCHHQHPPSTIRLQVREPLGVLPVLPVQFRVLGLASRPDRLSLRRAPGAGSQ